MCALIINTSFEWVKIELRELIMGKKSVKENKNAYQNSREEAGFTRQQASELMEFISADRIEKIENERTEPHPEEILAMSKCYKDASLCNY